jgi:hypothetical protein
MNIRRVGILDIQRYVRETTVERLVEGHIEMVNVRGNGMCLIDHIRVSDRFKEHSNDKLS